MAHAMYDELPRGQASQNMIWGIFSPGRRATAAAGPLPAKNVVRSGAGRPPAAMKRRVVRVWELG
eukprot:6980972-Pyramimonas_sp.AAC.1